MPHIYMKNEITGDVKQINKGFNWNVFLFGWIYLFIVGDFVSGIALLVFDSALAGMAVIANSEYFIYFILAIIVAHIWSASDFHKGYVKMLEKKDYKEIEQ